ncbi:FHA domain-containing protein [Leptolyngbya sp. CCY15150]|uniref:protein kinase domain-containing protein n=1 Tax=Leptolyngbya sp. CCY15150 TaxID=2767772 RepID=UPI0019502922
MITLFLLQPLKQIPAQIWTFENESVIRIGRSTDNHVVLYSAVVSRHHVELRRTGDNWEIVNLGTNGTYLDGKRITQVPAVDGAIIRLARSGPNIQIRMGTEALNTIPDVSSDRPLGEPLDDQLTDAEARETTGGMVNLSSVDDDEDMGIRGRSRRGTIPVPPHLQLTPDAPTVIQSFEKDPVAASTVAATRLRHPLTDVPSPGITNPTSAEEPTQVIHTVDTYQMTQVLGQGDIGITYLAWQKGQYFAVKTLNADWIGNVKANAALEYEGEILHQLDHPQLPRWINYFSVGIQPYLVMQLMPGDKLSQCINSHGPVSLAQAIAWILDICEVLSYLHQFTPPILHRGIRPNSLICPPEGKLALVDFGMVKTLALGQSIPAGRTAYTAPEQLDMAATPAVDLYALGPSLAYLVTGHNPVSFYGDRAQGYRFYADAVPGLHPELASVLDKLTDPNPDARYQSAHDLASDLRALSVS